MRTLFFLLFTVNLTAGGDSFCKISDEANCQNVNSTREYLNCMRKQNVSSQCNKLINLYAACIEDIEQFCHNADSEAKTLSCLNDKALNLTEQCLTKLAEFN